MGLLVNGKWQTSGTTLIVKGEFQRESAIT